MGLEWVVLWYLPDAIFWGCAVLEESVAKNALDIPWVTVAILWNTGVLVYRGVGGGRLFASAWTEPFGNRRCRRAWTQQM